MAFLSRNIALIAVIFALSGCWLQTPDVTLDEQLDLLEKDLSDLFVVPDGDVKPLSIQTAIARAIKYNLDYKASELEQDIKGYEYDVALYGVLPEVSISASASSRNNRRASSSRSISTGTTSLEASFSSDDTTRKVVLGSNWNVLQAGIVLSQSYNTNDEEKIAIERRRKVLHSIVKETQLLYWKTASAQLVKDELRDLITQSRQKLVQLREAEKQGIILQDRVLQSQLSLHKSINELMDVVEQIHSVKYELYNLLNLPPGEHYVLDITDEDFHRISPKIELSSGDLSSISLMFRPETREEVLKHRITQRSRKQEILNTIPGLEIFLSREYDSNSFLVNDKWLEIGSTLSQNLVNILTLPARLKKIEGDKKYADLRRKALLSAVMTQTYLANISYEINREQFEAYKDQYDLERIIFENAQNKYDLRVLSETAFLEIKIDTLLSRVNLHNRYIDMRYAYYNLIDTLGIDPVPVQNTRSMDLQELEDIIVSRYDNPHDAIIFKVFKVLQSYREDPKPMLGYKTKPSIFTLYHEAGGYVSEQ